MARIGSDKSAIERSALLRWSACVPCTLALAGCLVMSRDSLANDWPARFSKEAPQAWKDYLGKCNEIDAVVKSTLTYPSGKKSPPEGRWHVKLSYDNSVVTREGYSPDAVFGVNARYSFLLSRHDPKAGWAIAQVVPCGARASESRRGTLRDLAMRELFPQYLIGTEWLDKLVKEPSFKVTDAAQTVGDGTELVRVALDVRSQLLPAVMATFHGQLLLDAHHCWLPREYDVSQHDACTNASFDTTVHLACRNEYLSRDGNLLLKRHTVHTIAKNATGQVNEYEVIHDLDTNQRHIPDTEFTLSSFGLPSEPDLTKSEAIATPAARVRRTKLPNRPIRAEDESIIEYVLTNDTDRDVRVIGGQFGCGGNCCCRARNLPVTVPAHGSAMVEIGVHPASAGAFKQAIRLYCESGGLKKLVLHVEGEASPSTTVAEQMKP